MKHGTLNGYNTHKCRCRKCTDTASRYAIEATQRRRQRPIPREKHGTNDGYVGLNCRCPECRRAHRQYERIRNGKAASLLAEENEVLREERAELIAQIELLQAEIRQSCDT